MKLKGCLLLVAAMLTLSGRTLLGQTTVDFPDGNLEAAVRATLGKPTGSLTTPDLLSLTSLVGNSVGITNLSGLENALNLTNLNLGGNPIRDLTPLAPLGWLSLLDLSGAQVGDVAPLAGLTNLAYLELRFNPVTDCAPLAGLVNLSGLDLSWASITNVDFARHLWRLQSLDLTGNHVLEITAFAGLTNLLTLFMDENPVQDCATLSNCTKLFSLHLNHAQITNVDCLKALTRLNDLDLSSTGIKDLSPLTRLTNLTWLALNFTPGTNFNALAGLTNLVHFEAYYTGISDLSFVHGWAPRLQMLQVGFTLVQDLTPLAALTNLQVLAAEFAQITNIGVLEILPELNSVYLIGNLLDLSPGSLTLDMIKALQDRGVSISYQPQNQPLYLHVTPDWTIPAVGTSYLSFTAWDDVFNICSLKVTAHSSDTNVLPDAALELPGTNCNQVISVTPPRNQSGSTTIELTVTDNAGLSTSATVRVTVVSIGIIVQPVWKIAADATSYLSFSVSGETLTPVPLQITATSSNTNLVSDSGIELSQTNGLHWLAVTPAPNQIGSTVISMSLTNSAGVSNFATVTVTVAIGAKVVFADPNLDSFLRSLLNKPAGFFTTIDLESLTNVDASWQNIRNLSGLEYAANLRSLNLAFDWIGNAASLGKLTQLTELIAFDNHIADTTPLLGLTNLEHLNLSRNPITNIDNLCGLSKLRRLELETIGLTDLGALACLDQLEGLNLALNQIRDPAPLLRLVNLRELNLSDNPLTNFNVLAGFTNLTGIALGGTLLTSADFLSLLTGLDSLYMPRNNLENVSCLASLTNLLYLDLSENPITNYSGISALPNLTALTLGGNQLPDLSFLQRLTSLQYLYLADNLVEDLGGLASLTNLLSLDVSFNKLTNLEGVANLTNLAWLTAINNQLTNIAGLEQLPRLEAVYLQGNPLDLATDSPAMGLVRTLQNRGVMVYYQTSPPRIFIRPHWLIAADSPAALEFYVNDDNTGYQPGVITAHSSNPDLIPDANLLIRTNLYYQSWSLVVTPLPNRTGTTTITITATDIAALSTNATLDIKVAEPQAFDGRALDATNLVWATAGDFPWIEQTNVSHDGVSAAQSGDGSSVLQATVNGPGTFSFWWKLSTSDFWVPGSFMALNTASGVSGLVRLDPGLTWQNQIVRLGEGQWILKWEVTGPTAYYADSLSTLWLDQASFVPGPPTCWLELRQMLQDPRIYLVAHGEPGKTYALEVSSDLQNWSPLQILTMDSFESWFIDTNFDAHSRYYRLRSFGP